MPVVSIIKIPKCIGCGKELDPRMVFFPLCASCKVFFGFYIKNAKKDFGHSIARMDKENREKHLAELRLKIKELEL